MDLTQRLSRREFNKRSALMLALASSASMLTGGCNVYQDIENWTSVAEEAVTSLQTLLNANGIPTPVGSPLTAILNDILAGLGALHGAAGEYLATTPPPAGTLQKIQALLVAVSDNFGKFLQQLNLPGGGLLNLVASLVGLLLSTIAGFVNRLPAPTPSPTPAPALNVRFGGQVIPVMPKARSRRAFKKDFNGQLDAAKKSGGVQCPPSAYLKLSLFENL